MEQKEKLENEIFPFYLLSTSTSESYSYEININDIISGENIKLILLMNYLYDINWLINTCPILLVRKIILLLLYL